ncbi:interferon-induced protein 44-like [Coregonus clupeaformis]|uniref:interferon-induced protein 44-like n=1 Tax=Coregonus clupeaformis TaxID=59861 RepID=UPI001E1C54F2|nr:interferon-induced protein 44-like [Coregonus clupeaformis]
MGQTPSSPPPPSKEFDQEWRGTCWSKQARDAMVNALRNFELSDPDVGQLRCLLHGPVGAGKSSFINSVNNVFQGRSTHNALASAATGTSFTMKATQTPHTAWLRPSLTPAPRQS